MKTAVTFSGAVLSSLLCDNLKSPQIKEGLLIGEVTKVTTQSITDSSVPTENSIATINVTSFLSCPTIGMFYDQFGNVNSEYLESYLGQNYKKLVGWYRCRGCRDEIFLRERIIHKHLQNMMPPQHPFILGIFSSASQGGTGLMDAFYVFYEFQNNAFETVTHSIVNMNDTSGPTYITEMPTGPLYDSATLKNALQSISNFEPGVKDVESFYSKMLDQLRVLLPQCSNISDQCTQLTEELLQLKSRCYDSNIIPDFHPQSLPEPQEKDSSKTSKRPLKSTKPIANGRKLKSRENSPSLNNKDNPRCTPTRKVTKVSRVGSLSPSAKTTRAVTNKTPKA